MNEPQPNPNLSVIIASIDSILVEGRQRKEFNEKLITELAQSIATRGLLHPVVCVRDASGALRLVAGERRLRAIRLLASSYQFSGVVISSGFIPWISLSDTSAINVREAELEENLIRVDLTWQEKVQALDEIHKIKQAQNPKQSYDATARTLDTVATETSSRGLAQKISRASAIMRVMDDPRVQSASSEKEAFRIASRVIEDEFRAELAQRGLSRSTTHQLLIGDAREQLQLLLPGTFDLILVDPPYGMGADQFGDAAKLEHRYRDDSETALRLADDIFRLGFTLTKPQAHLYLFCDWAYFERLGEMALRAGWTPFRTPLIWNKGGSRGHAPIGERGFRRTYETLMFASKGGKAFSTLHSDVIECPPVSDKDHAAQKPVELYRQLIDWSCTPMSMVLDPCCGSGTIFEAASLAKVTAVGIEMDPEMAKIAQARLNRLA